MADDVRQWQFAIDKAEEGPLLPELPEPIAGQDYRIGDRKYIAAMVVSGSTGGRWAYWKQSHSRAEKQGPNENHEAIADRIFNHTAFHFAGMLTIAYDGIPKPMWILVEPRMTEGPRHEYSRMEPMADGKRYERSKEVYDVLTKESKILP